MYIVIVIIVDGIFNGIFNGVFDISTNTCVYNRISTTECYWDDGMISPTI